MGLLLEEELISLNQAERQILYGLTKLCSLKVSNLDLDLGYNFIWINDGFMPIGTPKNPLLNKWGFTFINEGIPMKGEFIVDEKLTITEFPFQGIRWIKKISPYILFIQEDYTTFLLDTKDSSLVDTFKYHYNDGFLTKGGEVFEINSHGYGLISFGEWAHFCIQNNRRFGWKESSSPYIDDYFLWDDAWEILPNGQAVPYNRFTGPGR